MSGYGSMGGEGQQRMDRMKDDLTQKTDDVMDQAREQGGQAIEKARGSAFQMMDQQKQRAADGLGSVASALRQTSDNLNNSDQGAIGQYADRAANAIEQFSQQLHDKDMNELFTEAERFARREPELFLGGAVVLGLLASRFFKASNRRSQMRNRDYGQQGYRGQYDLGYRQGNYEGSRMGPGGYDRETPRGEGIDYRSAGTGGYRTTVAGSSGAGSYGELNTGTTSDSMSVGHERSTSEFGQRRSGAINPGAEKDNPSRTTSGNETPDTGSSGQS